MAKNAKSRQVFDLTNYLVTGGPEVDTNFGQTHPSSLTAASSQLLSVAARRDTSVAIMPATPPPRFTPNLRLHIPVSRNAFRGVWQYLVLVALECPFVAKIIPATRNAKARCPPCLSVIAPRPSAAIASLIPAKLTL